MGQAKNRGTREQRIAGAKEDRRMDGGLHLFINETSMESVILPHFPCAECGSTITPDPSKNEVLLVPVRHGFQFGDCQNCSAAHLVISASTKADCVALEPVVAEMKRSGAFTKLIRI